MHKRTEDVKVRINLSRTKQNKKWLSLQLFLIIVLWIAFLPSSINWNFDFTHETVLLNSVIAVKNGLVLHRDIFEPKGFLYPTMFAKIQNIIPLNLSEAQYSRLLQYILVLGTVIITWWLLKEFSPKFQLVVPLFWLVGNQYWTLNSLELNRVFWLEPNYLITFFSLALVLIMIVAMKSERRYLQATLFVVGGLIIGSLPWIRVQGVFISLLLLISLLSLGQKPLIYKYLLAIGFSISLCSPLVYLYLRKSLNEWLQQIFIHPFLYTKIGSDHSTMSTQRLLSTLILFIGSALFLALFIILLGLVRENDATRVLIVLVLQICFLTTIFVLSMKEVDPFSDNNPWNWFIILLEYFPQLIPKLSLVATVIIFILLCINVGLKEKLMIFPAEEKVALKIMLMVNLGLLILLYPNIGHAFVLSLPHLTFFAIYLESSIRNRPNILTQSLKLGLFRLLCSLIIFSLLLLIFSVPKERFKLDSKYLSGTFITSSSSFESSKKVEKFLESVETRSTLVLCSGIIPFKRSGDSILATPYFGAGDNMQFADLQSISAKNALVCTGDSSEKEFLKAMSTFGIAVEKWRLKESLNLGDRYLGYLIVKELDNRGKPVIFSQNDSARE